MLGGDGLTHRPGLFRHSDAATTAHPGTSLIDEPNHTITG
jgi:hypothetical protein